MTNPNGLPETREELDKIVEQAILNNLSRVAEQMWNLARHQNQDETTQALNAAGNALDDVAQGKDR